MGIDHGVHGFYRYYKPWKLTRFKEITAEEQTLAMPEHGAWVNNYLCVLPPISPERCLGRQFSHLGMFKMTTVRTTIKLEA